PAEPVGARPVRTPSTRGVFHVKRTPSARRRSAPDVADPRPRDGPDRRVGPRPANPSHIPPPHRDNPNRVGHPAPPPTRNVEDRPGGACHPGRMRTVVFDLEATCWDTPRPRDAMEIIEIGAVALHPVALEPADEFTSFVRPVVNPQLSPFCTALTSITQA